MNMNVPLYGHIRHAAVREAEAKLAQQQAEYENRLIEIDFEEQSAYEQVQESVHTLELYDSRILPAAIQSVDSVRAGYVAGKVDFLRLNEAQRQLITLQERSYQANADYHRRIAQLERAIGSEIPNTANK